MPIHHASMFNYQQYQVDMKKFVQQVDQQNYKPLQEYAVKRVIGIRIEWPLIHSGHMDFINGNWREISVQNWPLYEHGAGALPKEDMIADIQSPTQQDLGYWFLICLAEYLSPCTSPLSHWITVYEALRVIGVNEKYYNLLYRGRPTHQLLKPGLQGNPPKLLRREDPYWFLLHPGNSKAGWLTHQDVIYLCKYLESAEEAINKFDVKLLPDIRTDNPVVLREYQNSLTMGYQQTTQMLKMARHHEQGLFMSISVI